ncbi:MAG: CCA tRNA nucleotidyltransferase [Candidatus Micrarchaeota archaeon]
MNLRVVSKLKKKALAKVSPSLQEAEKEKEYAVQLAGILEKMGGVRVSFVGSAARDTGLKGDRDIDLFVQFPVSLDEETIVKKTFDFTKKRIKADWITRYAEHPYLQAKIGEYKVEVIPCFIAEPHAGIKSAVDRSPLHMDYLQKRLSPAQREDVRILKQFLKNNCLYGAELAVRGFSGLVCEYLVLNYRSFEGVVENASRWKPPVRIDIEGGSQKQFSEKFVLIDAIDRNRNAGAVVSETNLNRFIALCQAFTKKPSEKFFFSKPTKPSKAIVKSAWKKRGTEIALFEFAAPDVVEDILAPQLKKTEENIARHVSLSGFPVFATASFLSGKKGFLLFEFTFAEKPRVKKIIGPPAWNEKAVEEFRQGKKPLRGPFVEHGRIVVEIEDKGSVFEELEKAKNNPERRGVASHLVSPLKKAILRKNESTFNAPCLAELQAYFLKKEPWW